MTSTSMTKKQTFELLKLINSVYPHFEVNQDTINNWHEFMKDQSFASVMYKAKEHIKREKFPPTVAELITVRMKKTRDQIEHEKMLVETGYYG